MLKSTFDNIGKNEVWRAMQRVEQLTELVLTGKKPWQMFCSDPGFGKTEIVLRAMKKHGLHPHYSSPSSASAFCADLWKHRNGPYFLDDCDRLARSEGPANIAKMAFGAQRLVVCPTTIAIQRNEERRLSGNDRYDPGIPEPTFRLGPNFGLIWNSNKDFTNPDAIEKEMLTDFMALVSRGLDPYWIPNDPQSLFDYTLWMVACNQMLRGHPMGARDNNSGGFSAEHVNDVLRFFCEHGQHLKEVSPRMAHKLAMSRRHDSHYEDAWKAQLSPTEIRLLVIPGVVPQVGSRKPQENVLENGAALDKPSIRLDMPPTPYDDPLKDFKLASVAAPVTLPATPKGVVLSLCDRTGNIVQPWAEAGFECICVDSQHPEGEHRKGHITFVGADLREWLPPPRQYAIVFAAPPCTNLAVAGASWFRSKGVGGLAEGIELVEICRRICEWTQAPWMIENPISTLSSYWRKPDFIFHPLEFGGYVGGENDGYTKKTCLWTGCGFQIPEKRPIPMSRPNYIHHMPPSPQRGDLRSVTPPGFSQAVFEANVLARERR